MTRRLATTGRTLSVEVSKRPKGQRAVNIDQPPADGEKTRVAFNFAWSGLKSDGKPCRPWQIETGTHLCR
jgi:hypothetical protein